jgi:hypothetical protein
MRTTCRVVMFGCACALALSGVLPAQQPAHPELVKQVLDAWQARRTAMKTVWYKIEGTELYPKGSMTEKNPKAAPKVRDTFPPEDLQLPKSVEYVFDFQNGGKIRKETHHRLLYTGTGEWEPRWEIDLHDGKTSSRYLPKDKYEAGGSVRHDATLFGTNASRMILWPDSYPILFGHGCPNLYGQMIDERGYFAKPLNPELFRFHQFGTLGNRQVVILRTIPEQGRLGAFDELWVDLSQAGAIVRWQFYTQGYISGKCEVTYQQVEGHWLPQSWKFDSFGLENGRPVQSRSETMEVTSVQVNPALDPQLFEVPLKHNMVIHDPYKDRTFSVASDDKTLVPFGHSTELWRWWHWLGGALVLAALVAGGLFFWRRRTVSQRSPSAPS